VPTVGAVVFHGSSTGIVESFALEAGTTLAAVDFRPAALGSLAVVGARFVAWRIPRR
jgi:hypothetical protein